MWVFTVQGVHLHVKQQVPIENVHATFVVTTETVGIKYRSQVTLRLGLT